MKGPCTERRRIAPAALPATRLPGRGDEVLRVTIENLRTGTRLPALAGDHASVPAPVRERLLELAGDLRTLQDGLLGEALLEDRLVIRVCSGGPLARMDRAEGVLDLAGPLLAAAERDPAARRLLTLVAHHEWRHACADALYGRTLSQGSGPLTRRRVTRAWVPGAHGDTGAPAPLAVSPGGPREELLVLADDVIEFLDLPGDEQEEITDALAALTGGNDPYLRLLEEAGRRGGIDEEVTIHLASLAAGNATGAIGAGPVEVLRNEAPALLGTHLALDRALADPRLLAPGPGEAARLLRGANDVVRLPPIVALSALPGPEPAAAAPLLLATAGGLRGLLGLRERRRRALRRLALLTAVEAAARKRGLGVTRGSAPEFVADVVSEILTATGRTHAALKSVVTADVIDLLADRADAALADGRAREALELLEAAAASAERRTAGTDAVWLARLHAVRRRANERLRLETVDEQAAKRARERRTTFTAEATAAARDPEAFGALLDRVLRAEGASGADVLAVCVAADRVWGGQFADTATCADLEARAHGPKATPALADGMRRFRGLLALSSGRGIDASVLDLEAAVEALASERLFEAIFGIEDTRARPALEARVADLLDGVGVTAGCFFQVRGLLRRERERLPPEETRARLAQKLRDVRTRFEAKRTPALRDELAHAEWAAGVAGLLFGETADAWERFHASIVVLASPLPGEGEAVLETVAALPRSAPFAEGNRVLIALGPVRSRLETACDLMSAIARAPDALTGAQRERAAATLERWQGARRAFPRVVRVRLDGQEREARLADFLEHGAGGKEGQFAALRHLFVGRPVFPFLGYHTLEWEGEGGRLSRFVAKVGITPALAQEYGGAFRLLIRDVDDEMARLTGNHQREHFVNRWLAAFETDLRERARARGREEARHRHEGRQADAQAARRDGEMARGIAEALLVPAVHVAEVGPADAAVPLLCTELVAGLREFPKSRFSREADMTGLIRRVRRQEERIAAGLAVLAEEAKDDVRRRSTHAPAEVVAAEAGEAVRRVRGHAACLTLLLANTDFQLFTSGPRMVALDMAELILPEVFRAEAAGVSTEQTRRIDVAVVTEGDRPEDFADVTAAYQRFLLEHPDAVGEAARAAGFDEEMADRLTEALGQRARALPEALALLVESGGTLAVGRGGKYLPRQRGSGTRFLRRAEGRGGAAAPPVPERGGETVTLTPGDTAPRGEATVSLAPGAAAPGGDATVTLSPGVAGPTSGLPTVAVDRAGRPLGAAQALPAPTPLAAVVPPPAPEPPPLRMDAGVLLAVAHPGRRGFLVDVLEEFGVAPEEAEDALTAAARVRAGGIHILILDLEMPEVSGHEVLRVARSSAPAPVYAIVLATPEDVAGADLVALAPDAVILRPLKRDLVHAHVARALRPA